MLIECTHQYTQQVNHISDTTLRVVNGLIELTEDMIVEGCDELGKSYTLTGARPTELSALSGVKEPIQTKFDNIHDEVNAINSELNSMTLSTQTQYKNFIAICMTLLC